MTNEEFNEVQSERWSTLNNMLDRRFSAQDKQLDKVEVHLATLNGKVLKQAEMIADVQLNAVKEHQLILDNTLAHANNCPINPKVMNILERITELETDKKVALSMKHLVITALGIVATLVGMTYTIFKFNADVNFKANTKIEKMILQNDSLIKLNNTYNKHILEDIRNENEIK